MSKMGRFFFPAHQIVLRSIRKSGLDVGCQPSMATDRHLQAFIPTSWEKKFPATYPTTYVGVKIPLT